ncbi:MAG: FAD-dependent oxidoreductase [Opitutus sp.]|nr:FAD-dependent oxidoreductase [Opitutus sp.]
MNIAVNSSRPVAVIGAGPVGLAAAAHLADRGLDFVLLESGNSVGAAVRSWSHVRLFSPWRYNVDAAAVRLLAATRWRMPDPEAFPTGGELFTRYLEPLSRLPAIAARLRLQTKVTAITRVGRDRMKNDPGRETAPFRLRLHTAAGESELLARTVIDTSGTWQTPNPLGAEGVPARGERELAAHIAYGIPDVLGRDRARYAGRRVLVVGSGHSAFNVLVDLAHLANEAPGTRMVWALRRDNVDGVFGGGTNDRLAARGALGAAVRRLLDADLLTVERGFKLDALVRTAGGIVARSGERASPAVDEIIGATGFRPDFSFASELQLGLDPAVGSTPALAPMIDPNLHSCGTVRPHGHRELAHPESGFYIAGMKSYGRAPTFLMLTGYEQVRSIVAAIAGDLAAADEVRLALPETGVCTLARKGGATCCAADTNASGDPASIVEAEPERGGGCCGGAPRENAAACCVADEEAKAAGAAGCGCGGGRIETAARVAAVESAG